MSIETKFLGILMLWFNANSAIAQSDTSKVKREYVIYSLFYNSIPENFNYPLVGLVNVAKASHKGVQLGFANTTLMNFVGLQAGFINTTLINTEGIQLGFINIANKGIRGSQIGFINVTDTIENGIPIGFLSFVKKGGYKAVETSINELYPFNLSFKIGVTRLYSYLESSYNYRYSNSFAFGLGFGSLFAMGPHFYFNPEIGILSPVSSHSNDTSPTFATKLVTSIRYGLNSRLQLAAGISTTWLNYSPREDIYGSSFLSLVDREINLRNRILIGPRVALSYNFRASQHSKAKS